MTDAMANIEHKIIFSVKLMNVLIGKQIRERNKNEIENALIKKKEKKFEKYRSLSNTFQYQ